MWHAVNVRLTALLWDIQNSDITVAYQIFIVLYIFIVLFFAATNYILRA